MEENTILQLQGVRKRFGDSEILEGIDLKIRRGEFITLLGASGCGKTTTLRIIAGLEFPDSGRVILEGRDITELEPNKRSVNTVFQNYALFPHMNVADNIGYGLKIRKVSRAVIAKKVEEMLHLVQLEGFKSGCRRSFPEDRNRGWRSPGRWSMNRRFCFWMSLWGRWI